MIGTRSVRGVGVALLATALLGGCLERRETIVVEADGWVRMRVAFETKSFGELYLGDAVPVVEGGWLVVESVERDDEGAETFRLEAEAEFPPEVELPSTYASPMDADADLRLQFPTTVLIEDRADGTYYHFSRRYPARPWAFLENAREMLKKHMDSYKGRDFETLSVMERGDLLRGLLEHETGRGRTFARAAFLETMPDTPQDVWLAIHHALADLIDELDVETILARIVDEESQVDDAALNREEQALETRMVEVMTAALRHDAGIGQGRTNVFLSRYQWHREHHDITEDLGDDAFEITVTMPGVVVGHNGDAAAGSSVTWKFGGAMFRDRDLELMVTSVVANQG